MQLSASEAERIARDGAQALQAGNAAEARRRFEQLTVSGRANAQIWLLLAHACRQLGDWTGAESAAEQVLERDGRNLRALILKGDSRAGAGDDRAGASFYRAAMRIAADLRSLPPDLAAELARVERSSAEIDRGFRDRLSRHLEEAGFSGDSPTARFRESVAILLEEKQVYFQQPTAYYFPGLPQVQFYERGQFDWVPAVEQAAGDIRRELEQALKAKAPFKPYFEARANRPRYDFHGLLDNPAWSTLYLWENGKPVEDNVARFPRTFEAMRDVPLPHITVRSPSILFSWLQPGARIAPHHGMINARLICHLPLIVPPGCGFRVGNDVREWEVGKMLIFDDTIEHEAWNDSDEDRMVLIFDIWRPELSPEERRAVTAIFEAIDGDETVRTQ